MNAAITVIQVHREKERHFRAYREATRFRPYPGVSYRFTIETEPERAPTPVGDHLRGMDVLKVRLVSTCGRVGEVRDAPAVPVRQHNARRRDHVRDTTLGVESTVSE